MNSPKHLFNLFYIFICITWVPIQRYYLQVDGAGRTILALSLLAVLFNIGEIQKRRHIFRSPAFICWNLLVLFSMINSFLKGFISEWGTLAFYQVNYIVPYVTLVTLIVELDINKKRCLRVLLWALMTFVFIGFIHMAGDTGERMEAEELGNALPLNAVCALLVSAFLYTQYRMKNFIFFTIVAILFLLIIASGTRKALGASVIILIGTILSKNSRLTFSSILQTTFWGLLIYYGIVYVLEHTLIGLRIVESVELTDVVFTDNKPLNDLLLTILGDRATMYWQGWFIWLQHPITGIGVMNFMIVSGIPFRLHTEYMVQLCENGLIGFILLVSVYYFLFKSIRRRKSMAMNTKIMILFTLFSLLFLNLTAWTYSAMFGMIFYGILYAEIYSQKNNR